ncbi:GLEYA domain-domain-containing protein [Microdochium bolleyi]|uniref:GLEYA domain-domain-containing protein n=1 Tax=Microdochium bolleyi TaxID=196109 RepID=A0A136ISY9_9PEZI|nr:GLEYA domain-domain-containing protein [Microdochium bolleyi]
MRASSNIVPLLLPLAAYAAPAPAPQGGILNPLICLLNNLLVGLRNDPLATPYCSSVLGIQPRTVSAAVGITVAPTITSTVNVGGATATLTIGRTVTAGTVTSTTTATTTVTSTVRSTTSVSTITCLDAAYTAPVGRRAIENDAPELEKRQSAGVSVIVTPTIIAPSAQPAQVSQACSCLGLTTNTITVTPTIVAGATVTSLATVNLGAGTTITLTLDTTTTSTVVSTSTTTATTTTTQNVVGTNIANPLGLQFKRYTHDFSAFDNSADFNVAYFKAQTPVATGFSPSPRISSPGWPFGGSTMSIGGQDFDGDDAAIIYQGFYVARATGDHTFSSSGDTIDNWGYFWSGNTAYSTYSDLNFNFRSVRVDGAPYTGGTQTVQMNQGDAIPVAWLWANGGGAGQSDFTVSVGGSGGTGGGGNFVPACSPGTFN